jgi:hypothetical protein
MVYHVALITQLISLLNDWQRYFYTMCCRFIQCVLSVQILAVPVNTFFFFVQIPKVIVHPPYTRNRFPILPVLSPFLRRSSSFTSSVCSFSVCLLFNFVFSSFLVSNRCLCHSALVSGPYVWDYLIPLPHDQLSTFEIHLPMSALCQDIELPFSGV